MIYEVENFPSREITIQNEKFLYFGGTAYLGLQTDKDFQEIFIDNIKKYGTNYGASRKANVQLAIYEKAENYLADFIGSEDCLTLSSGFLTGQMLVTYFHATNRQCFYAPATHEALHVLNTKNHESFDELVHDINHNLETTNKNPVLFLDSMLLNGKNYPDFEWLGKINLERITVAVDDSHGFGIVGKNGTGVYELLAKLNPRELFVCGSLGKGFGIQAGFIAGTKTSIENLRSTNMYAAASPAAPATMATLLASKKITDIKRKILLENIQHFISNISRIEQFKFLPNYPCFAFENEKLAAHLEKNKILVTNFNYPEEKDHLVLRIVLNANHTQNDIKRLTTLINNFS
ncbi:aminotransferase class I/II-fold pyridoxal phosphate-dependent enzyme [Aurantibacter sp.]|uniref:aminotransferase class I/II-fold pyridoxal phosphate-dependent enzyme n=1 Tax=Aurantibacter sp. TaxID=2807103 RepID=UPI0032654084